LTRGTLFKDFRLGARVLARNRGFAAMALLTLALGIGASAAIFSFVDAVLLRPLPYSTADRIVRVLETRPSGDTAWVSTPDFLDWQAQNTSFDQLAAQQSGVVTLAGAEPVPLRVLRVTANFFDVFGVKATLGRTFVAGEDLAVSGVVDAATLEPAVRRALHAATEQAVLDVRTLEQLESGSLRGNRFQTALLAAFSLAALALASVGIFGVQAYSVVQRGRELGIRAALGASRSDLVKRVLRQGMALTAAGVVLGLVAAYASAPLLAPLLYRTGPHDGVLMAAAAMPCLPRWGSAPAWLRRTGPVAWIRARCCAASRRARSLRRRNGELSA
jgi:hypothetical protein